MKDCAAHDEHQVSNIIHGKTEGVRKDIKDGCHERMNSTNPEDDVKIYQLRRNMVLNKPEEE